VALSSSLLDIDINRLRPQFIDGRTMIYVEPTIRNGWRAAAKRVFDIAIALVALIPTAFVVAAASIANLFTSRGPVFFRQTRVGRDGKPFEIVKLRTMVVDAEARKAELMELNESDGALFKIKNDPRITPIGRILRILSLDELPQFWNVLRGEMSVVGPRPALPDEVEKWPADVHERLRVLPGITGMWQVSGRSDASFDQYKRLDLYYVDNWSILHDLTIVAKTFGAVVSSRGAS
jgi:exopolysaccharide biosynthesis polyprenyl glycosylphosphotransferase